MSFLESINIAIRSLRANKMRSFLTTLGITAGIAALICTMAVGAGARDQVIEKIRRLGTNLLLIQPEEVSYSGAKLNARVRRTLTEDDGIAIKREVPGVEIAATIIWGKAQVISGNKNWSTTVWGNDSDYLQARDWPVVAGRRFSAGEIRFGSKVTIIGQVIADKLFDGNARLGATIRINNVPFEVIGVLGAKGEAVDGESDDDMVLVPLVAARSRVLGGEHSASRQAIDYLVVKFATLLSPQEAKQYVEEKLRERHRLTKGSPNDFSILNSEDVFAAQAASAKAFSLLLLSIASISLIVGGISIMNIMLVAVTDRTREIGLRMAVGARRADIRNQFLVEASALALLGGVLGTIVGSVAAAIVAGYGEWPVLISPIAVLLAWGGASIVGLIFGLWPAYRASRLDPMVALHFE